MEGDAKLEEIFKKLDLSAHNVRFVEEKDFSRYSAQIIDRKFP